MHTRIFGPALSEKCSTVGVMHGISMILSWLWYTCQEKKSAACYVFLGKTGATITGTVTGGMEIPWVMKFAGDKIMVNEMKSLLIDMRRPIPSSRGCSGTTSRSKSCSSSCSSSCSNSSNI